MDRMVGDDIASGVRQIVRQLLNLASDPDSQPLMQDNLVSTIIGVMTYRVHFWVGVVHGGCRRGGATDVCARD